MPQAVPGTSLNRNGTASSEATQLVSTLSIVASTLSDLCRTTSRSLESSKSTMPRLNQPSGLKRPASGIPHGQRPLKRLFLPSHTVDPNLMNIEGIYKTFSTPSSADSIQKSSSMTKPLGTSLEEVKPSGLPISQVSSIYKPRTSTHLVWRWTKSIERERNPEEYAVDSTGERATLPVANSGMYAEDVEAAHMDEWSVLNKNRDLIQKPKYLRYNEWDSRGKLTPGVISWSLSASPLPSAPSLPFEHPISKTIRERSDLFKIITPINVPCLRYFLRKHPNRAFCNSICEGLENGFWPWANVDPPGYPATHDESRVAS
jgi:hypothetical protein